MSWLDPIKPYWAAIKLAAFAAIVLAAVLYGRGCGKRDGEADMARMRTERAQELAELARLSTVASEKARAAERAVDASFATIHDQHARERAQAAEDEKATVAAILADPRRLRPEWRCPAAPAPGVADGPGRGDDAAQLRAEGAGALIGDADRADADIRAWQSRWEAWRVEYEKYRAALK